MPVEGNANSELARSLDMNAGIDAWQFNQKGQMRGIASRIQWGTAWDTFTVRYYRNTTGYETEYKKRKDAYDNPGEGWLTPHYTIQAYISNPPGSGDLLSAAVVKTRDLIAICNEMESQFRATGYDATNFDRWRSPDKLGGIRRTGNAVFFYVPWSAFALNAISIYPQLSLLAVS